MHAITSSRPTVRRVGRGAVALLAIVLAAALGAPLGQAAGNPPSSDPPAGIAAGGPAAAAGGETRQVTLLTGDVVVWHRSADGEQTAWLQRPATRAPRRAPVVYEQDGQVHVVPVEALPYLDSGVLDPNLFNVTLLVRQGYDDQLLSHLPLLLQGSGRPAVREAPAVPEQADRVRVLDSVGMVSVRADKDEARAVWESLRGPRAAAATAEDASLSGAAKVWLNGTVQATLEDSVEQIGAPEAWAAGFDGEGTDVAILDSGWDPTHPDLQRRVETARNFTTDEDPPGVEAVDLLGHGTHVAATVAGSGDASAGARVGVAPGADLMIGKVLDRNGTGTWDEIIAGMEWAAGSGAEVVNMSLGTPFATDGKDPLSQALNQLTRSSGALFVVAAGNAGPGEMTVGAPGAADLALTVGAVTKDDEPTTFSSRGPRLGDGAIKPEVVAPGAGIVAARAHGTSLGFLLDAHYTAMSGTSMATPHVAGAAALLAQQHPGWDADDIKSRLVATSTTLDDAAVTFQGAGRIDVAAAVGDAVTVSDAALSLGRIPQGADPVSHTLTYSNPSDRPVYLRMSAEVFGTGVDHRERPELSFSRKVLKVPAGGTSGVRVQLTPRRTEGGAYAGQIVAKQVGSPSEVHTVTSFEVDGPLRTLTVDALDREGRPATGSVDVWSAETGDWQRLWLEDGTVSVQVPEGLYAVLPTIEPAGSGFSPIQQTVAGDPDVRISRDLTLDFDAREGSPVRIDTPRPADAEYYEVIWQREVGRRSMKMIAASGYGGRKLFMLHGPRAQSGTFDLATQWQLVEPMLTARTSGPDGFRISPSPDFASLGDPFVGEQTLGVVYAGHGTPEEFASVDAQGKVALVTRGDQGLWAQVQAAKEEGVALLLAHNDDERIWTSTVWRQGLPTYRLSLDAGARLRDALADDPGLTLELDGLQDSTYAYELAFMSRSVPKGPDYDISSQDLAAVTSDYRHNSDRMSRSEGWVADLGPVGIGQLMSTRRNGPVVRTDYVTASDEVAWQRFAQPHGEFPSYYWTWSAFEHYEPGETGHQVWWGPLVHPAVLATYGIEELGSPVARYRDAIRILMPHYSYGGSLQGTIDNRFGDVSELTLSSNGEVLGKAPWPEAQFTVPAGEAEYQLNLEVRNGAGNFMDTSSRTDTTWTFRSARPEAERAVLPLLQLRYGLDTNAYNEVPAGSTYPLTIEADYQPGAEGPGGLDVTVEVSYDDGESWSAAPVREGEGVFNAEVPAAGAPGFATVRVVATDQAGNRLEQQIDRAWRIGD